MAGKQQIGEVCIGISLEIKAGGQSKWRKRLTRSKRKVKSGEDSRLQQVLVGSNLNSPWFVRLVELVQEFEACSAFSTVRDPPDSRRFHPAKALAGPSNGGWSRDQ